MRPTHTTWFWTGLWALPFILLASPIVAQTSKSDDPCAMMTEASNQTGPRARLDHKAAIYFVTHAQRACRSLRDFPTGNFSTAEARQVLPELRGIIDELRANILEPVYREHPDLRGQDLSAAPAASSGAKGSPLVRDPTFGLHTGDIGPATATHLRWAVSRAEADFFKAMDRFQKKCAPAHLRECADAGSDTGAEIGFIGSPLPALFPEFVQIDNKEWAARLPAPGRTATSDAAYRKAAPPPGTVQLTPAAALYLKEFAAEVRRQMGPGCRLMVISWDLGTASKGPDDSDWRRTGPGVGIGADACQVAPAEVIRTISGIRIIFSGDDAGRFAGKTIDAEKGKFFFRDGAPKGAAQ